MIYKVGDRVRVIANHSNDSSGDLIIGREGVIARSAPEWPEADTWIVHVPGSVGLSTKWCAGDEWACNESELAPLLPPAADTWAADAVRKVTKPQHVEKPAPQPAEFTYEWWIERAKS